MPSRISELPAAIAVSSNALVEIAVPDAGSPSFYSSRRTTVGSLFTRPTNFVIPFSGSTQLDVNREFTFLNMQLGDVETALGLDFSGAPWGAATFEISLSVVQNDDFSTPRVASTIAQIVYTQDGAGTFMFSISNGGLVAYAQPLPYNPASGGVGVTGVVVSSLADLSFGALQFSAAMFPGASGTPLPIETLLSIDYSGFVKITAVRGGSPS